MKPIHLAMALALLGAASIARPARAVSDLTLERSDAAGVTFLYRVPAVSMTPIPVGGRTLLKPEIARTAMSGEPGSPRIPVRSFLVGVPFGAQVSVEVEAAGPSSQTEGALAPVPTFVWSGKGPAAVKQAERLDLMPREYARSSFRP